MESRRLGSSFLFHQLTMTFTVFLSSGEIEKRHVGMFSLFQRLLLGVLFPKNAYHLFLCPHLVSVYLSSQSPLTCHSQEQLPR